MSSKSANIHNFSKNVFYFGLLQIINLLVGLVLPRLFLSTYGSEVNGVISTANNFISYFTYIEAGLGAALMHALYKPLAEKNYNDISCIVTYSAKSYRRISFIYFILVVVLSFLFPLVSHDTSMNYIEFSLLFFVIGLYGAIDFFTMAKYRVLLVADKKEYIVSIAGIVAQLMRFVLVAYALTLNISVVAVKCLPIITLLIRSTILKIYIKKKYPTVVFNCQDVTPPHRDVKKRWDAMLLQISINASITLPTIIISQVLGYKEANVFAMYYLVCNAIVALVSAFSSGIAPILGQAIAKDVDITGPYNLYEYFIAIVLTTFFSIGAVLILPFIQLYTSVVSDINYSVAAYGILIMIWGALHTFRIPYTAVVNAAALYTENRILNIVNILLLVTTGIAFTILWGIIGTLLSMLIVAIQRNVCMVLILKKDISAIDHRKSLKRMGLMTCIILISYFVSVLLQVSKYIGNWSQWIMWAFPTGVFCILITVGLFYLIERQSTKVFFNYIFNKVKRR